MSEFQRYYMELAFNGKNYHGWQFQPNAISVQQKIEEALTLVLKEQTSVIGAGRTDTGVHASFFTLHFDSRKTDLNFNDKLIYQLNGILPPDIAIYRILKVDNGFHARFDAISRTYKYFIHLRKDPLNNDYSAYIKAKPSIDLMNKAAKIIEETKDFKSFCKAHSNNKTTICHVSRANWKQKSEHKLVFTISADRFLRNMVRAITGTILNVGCEKINMDQFMQIIKSGSRQKAGYSVPAHALFLTDIHYNCNVFIK